MDWCSGGNQVMIEEEVLDEYGGNVLVRADLLDGIPTTYGPAWRNRNFHIITPDEDADGQATDKWSALFESLKHLHGSSNDLYKTYLYQYLFHVQNDEDRIFNHLLNEIRNWFPIERELQMPRRTPTRIVDTVNDAASVLQTAYTWDSRKTAIDSGANLQERQMKVLKFCARWGLIANERPCIGACQGSMHLLKRGSLQDGYRWGCNPCTSYTPVTSGSIFDDSELQIRQVIQLLYIWSNRPQTHRDDISRDVGVSKPTIIKYFDKFREITEDWCRDHLMNGPQTQIGGPGTIVEIDESLFYKQKYHVGQLHRQQWVFGMIERGTNNVIMVPVDRRDAATLLPIIERHVAPGTRIISDGLAAYGGIAQLQHQFNGIIQQKYAAHDVINHSVHFVDPADPDIHTQSIEGTWHAVKESMRRLWGTTEEKIQSYLFQYMFKRSHNKEKIFENMLFWIRTYTGF